MKRTPIILAAFLAIFAAFASWYQFTHRKHVLEAKEQEKSPLMYPSGDTQVVAIKIKTLKELIDLKCESAAQKTCTRSGQGTWKFSSGEPADGNAVRKALIETLDHYPAEPIDLSAETPEKRRSLMIEYGLSEELRLSEGAVYVELILAGEDGAPSTRTTEWFGNEDGLGISTFVGSGIDGKMNEQKVFVLNKTLKSLTAQRTKESFRTKTSAN